MYFSGRVPSSSQFVTLQGSVSVAGAAVTWLRDNFKFFERSDEIEALCETVHDNGGAVFVPAFNGLFAPHWRSDARGIIIGKAQQDTTRSNASNTGIRVSLF
jgi:glycerol kinase